MIGVIETSECTNQELAVCVICSVAAMLDSNRLFPQTPIALDFLFLLEYLPSSSLLHPSRKNKMAVTGSTSWEEE